MIQLPKHLKNYTNLANIQAYPAEIHKILMENYSDQTRSEIRTITTELLRDIYLPLYSKLLEYFEKL